MSQPLTARALERALRRRILRWGRDGDSLARLREDVEQALAGPSVKVPAVDLDHGP
jgi:hypothetical protein